MRRSAVEYTEANSLAASMDFTKRIRNGRLMKEVIVTRQKFLTVTGGEVYRYEQPLKHDCVTCMCEIKEASQILM